MNELKSRYKIMQELIMEGEVDLVKFESGNNSAGTRVRKNMQAIKNIAQEIRLEVQQVKNSVTA
jgi:hypothetical protein